MGLYFNDEYGAVSYYYFREHMDFYIRVRRKWARTCTNRKSNLNHVKISTHEIIICTTYFVLTSYCFRNVRPLNYFWFLSYDSNKFLNSYVTQRLSKITVWVQLLQYVATKILDTKKGVGRWTSFPSKYYLCTIM